ILEEAPDVTARQPVAGRVELVRCPARQIVDSSCSDEAEQAISGGHPPVAPAVFEKDDMAAPPDRRDTIGQVRTDDGEPLTIEDREGVLLGHHGEPAVARFEDVPNVRM